MFASVLQLAIQWTPLPMLVVLPAVTMGPGPVPATVDGRGDVARQVRIEQRMQIRVIARPGGVIMDAPFSTPDDISRPRIKERRMGKCLGNAMIGGVTMRSDNQLLLYLRDQRVVSATLERSCHARDFYSGFYLARSVDGKLCVDRDVLLSRSGANCKIKQIRELIDKRR
jgi:hypothetical protein